MEEAPVAEEPGHTISVTGVSLDKSSITIAIGRTEQLSATVAPDNAANKNVAWSSSNTSFASVSSEGLITALAVGNAIVTVITEDGNFSATCSVTVQQSAGDKRTYSADSVSFFMVYVPAKSFKTGTDDSGTATVLNPYWIGETEVTYELWNKVYTWAGSNGYAFANAGTMGDGSGDTNQHPVTTVNWRDCMVWCNAATEWYNAKTGSSYVCVYTYDGGGGPAVIRDSRDANATACDNAAAIPTSNGFRLPSTNEWELAARYKTDSNNDGDITDAGEYYAGNYASGATAAYTDAAATGAVAWYDANSVSTAHAVKGMAANALGIFDMSGNVWEGCFDWYPGQ